MGYMRWAAKLDVQIDELEVQVHADYDTRGELGVSDKYPGYSKIKYLVNIVSPSSKDKIIEVLDTADKYSSYIDHFIRPIELEREINFNINKEVEL
jgi:hypothetical protein